jgi:hypothetical protein
MRNRNYFFYAESGAPNLKRSLSEIPGATMVRFVFARWVTLMHAYMHGYLLKPVQVAGFPGRPSLAKFITKQPIAHVWYAYEAFKFMAS